MTPLLLLVAACSAIAIAGWIISKVTGSHAWYLEDWQFNDGETTLWRDDAADVSVIPKLGQAVVMTPVRLHRSAVVVTSERIVIGKKTLTGKQMVEYVLYPGEAPDSESKRIDGGLLTRGYSTLVIQRDVIRDHLGDETRYPYVALTPLEGERSSVNVSEIRIYTDVGASFRLA